MPMNFLGRRLILTVLLLASLVVPAQAVATPAFTHPQLVAQRTSTPVLATGGGVARFAWESTPVAGADTIQSADLLPSGTTSTPVTLASSDSNPLGQPSTYVQAPRAVVDPAGSATLAWDVSKTDAGGNYAGSTFALTQFAPSGEPAAVVGPQAGGSLSGPVLEIGANGDSVVLWANGSNGLSLLRISPSGEVSAPHQVVAPRQPAVPGGTRLMPVGLTVEGKREYIVWSNGKLGAPVKTINAARLHGTRAAAPRVLLKSRRSAGYYDATVSGDGVYAFRRKGDEGQLVTADPRRSRHATGRVLTPPQPLPTELVMSTGPSGRTAAVWRTDDFDVVAAVLSGHRRPTLQRLTKSGRGADVVVDAAGRATVVWRDRLRDRSDTILANQLSRKGRPSGMSVASGGSRGISPAVGIAHGHLVVSWLESGGGLKFSISSR